MRLRWLLAVVVCGGLACAEIAYGACDQGMLQKLLDRGFGKDEILRLCGQTDQIQNEDTIARGMKKYEEERNARIWTQCKAEANKLYHECDLTAPRVPGHAAMGVMNEEERRHDEKCKDIAQGYLNTCER